MNPRRVNEVCKAVLSDCERARKQKLQPECNSTSSGHHKYRPPTARRFRFPRFAVPLRLCFVHSSHSTSSPKCATAMHLRRRLPSTTHHAPLYPFFGHSDCPPLASISGFLGSYQFHLDRNQHQPLAHNAQSNSNIGSALQARHFSVQGTRDA